jgi:hypothetical protein
MSTPTDETPPETVKFDFSAFPPNSLFYDRRSGLERRDRPAAQSPEGVDGDQPAPRERRARKERRKRVDPTTFEKQYTEDEIEFMNSIQRFKTRTGKSFPTYGEVLRIAASLGYRKGYLVDDDEGPSLDEEPSQEAEACLPR